MNTNSTASEMSLTLYGIHEEIPGPQWKALFDATWPAYRAWYLRPGGRPRPDLDTCRERLHRHMPELVPTWERLVELTGADPVAARMLSGWDPPRFLPGCAQAVVFDPEPALIRNYDYAPELFESVVYSSAFTGRRVVGTSDCLWGLLDGVNDAGLAVSLAFGGRPGSGPGFGIPMVMRYLLEVAGSVAEARALLRRVPVSMSYNLTMVDSDGAHVTAYVAAERDVEFSDLAAATNHRGLRPEYPEHAGALRSVERQTVLRDLLATGPSAAAVADALMRPPLRNLAYDRAFGTLYTATYRPADGCVEYSWPGDSWRRSFGSPSGTKSVHWSA